MYNIFQNKKIKLHRFEFHKYDHILHKETKSVKNNLLLLQFSHINYSSVLELFVINGCK